MIIGNKTEGLEFNLEKLIIFVSRRMISSY